MADTKKIKTALISVFHKDGLDELLRKLNSEGVKFLSTGGTQSFIESLGYECQKVEDVTTYPSILGGRVKTLHPKVFGGILARRDNEGDREQMAQYGHRRNIAHTRRGKELQRRCHRAEQGRVPCAARHSQPQRSPDHSGRAQDAGRARLRREQPLRHGHTQLVQLLTGRTLPHRR